MKSESLIQHDADSVTNPQIPARGVKQTLPSEDVEARIRRLTCRLEKMDAASHLVWLENGPHVYDPEFDLNVKVEAVRWMLRIARHMNQPAREVVFLRIEKSLRQLEAAVESFPRTMDSGAAAEPLLLSIHA